MQLVSVNGSLHTAITERQGLNVKVTKGWRLTRRGRLVMWMTILIIVSVISHATADICWVGNGYGSCEALIDSVTK